MKDETVQFFSCVHLLHWHLKGMPITKVRQLNLRSPSFLFPTTTYYYNSKFYFCPVLTFRLTKEHVKTLLFYSKQAF